jgi:hypothetical protein
MDEKDTRNENQNTSASDVESTTRDDNCKDEAKEYEAMIPA